MRTFVINLAKNKERMAAMKRQLDNLGVAFERFDAIYGAALSEEEIRKKADRFRWWCILGVRPTRGEIGCALSHCSIYKKMMDENIPVACVLEDDCTINQDVFLERCRAVEQFVDCSRPQVVQLRHPQEDRVMRREILSARSSVSAEAYVVTLPAARLIYRANIPVRTPVDVWGRFVRQEGLEFYVSHPSVLVPGTMCDFSTDVSDATCRKRGRHGFLWPLVRLFGKSFDTCLRVVEMCGISNV